MLLGTFNYEILVPRIRLEPVVDRIAIRNIRSNLNVRAKELWRIAPEWLEQAQDDATLLAIRDQERAGLDIVTDGRNTS
jgi:hypothetical protein